LQFGVKVLEKAYQNKAGCLLIRTANSQKLMAIDNAFFTNEPALFLRFCRESRIFVPAQQNAMKKSAFILLLSAAGFTVSAQTKTTADSSRLAAEDIGTTAYGLPVHKSYVPADAAERAKKKYGRALYSIEKSTAENCQESYLVGLIRKGHLTMEWMCDDPKMVWHWSESESKNLLVKH
jgi:hypothetical protein